MLQTVVKSCKTHLNPQPWKRPKFRNQWSTGQKRHGNIYKRIKANCQGICLNKFTNAVICS